jgi:dTDP-4-dehydrorhamnose 3,5-epimerase-like enzyme
MDMAIHCAGLEGISTLMQAQRLAIPDVVCFTPKVFGDDRGFFYESFNPHVFE